MPETEIIIPTSDITRLRVSRWDAQRHNLVAINSQYLDTRTGEWKLASAAVAFAPSVAAEVGAAIAEVAAHIDGAPVDPMPTERDREESRMP